MHTWDIYFIGVFLSSFYVFYKSNITKYSVFFVFVFWSGLFFYLGLGHIYKIFLVAFGFIIFAKNITKKSKHDGFVNFAFLLFTISFWATYFIQGGALLTILSQYFYKYGFVYLLYHGLKDIISNEKKRVYIKHLFFNILMVQIGLAIYKIMLVGFGVEEVVTSISEWGGGVAVVIPIIGLFFYSAIKKHDIRRNEIIFSALFLIIGIASSKRTPVFLFPVYLALILLYNQSSKHITNLFKKLPLIALLAVGLLYVGIRLAPSLNPENKVWGSFSLQYAYEYVLRYNFGTTDLQQVQDVQRGRGASLFLIFSPEAVGLQSFEQKIFGRDFYGMAVKEEGHVRDGGYDIQHTGLAGEAIPILYSIGYFGLFTMLIFAFSLIRVAKPPWFRLLIVSFFLFEFFLYKNQVVFNNASASLLIFLCFYTHTLITKNPAKENKQNLEEHSFSQTNITNS